MTHYAGIGARDTPPDVAQFMSMLATTWRTEGRILRSGRSGSADLAFERSAYGQAELFEPWPRFEAPEAPVDATIYHSPTQRAFDMAADYHPRWDRCSAGARALLARNCHVILGRELIDPVGVVVCFTKDATLTGLGSSGGTAHALRIAHAHKVKVYNLAIPAHVRELTRMQWGVLDGCERPRPPRSARA